MNNLQKMDDDDFMDINTMSINNCVKRIDNQLFFYGDINETNVRTFKQELYLAQKELRDLKDEARTLIIRFSSSGGSLYDAFSAMEALRQCEIPTVGVVEGYCASACTLLFLCCNGRVMGKYSYFLIHQLSGEHWGTYKELEDSMKNNKKLMDTLSTFYQENTKIPKKQLQEILQHDLWLDAEECKKFGIISAIV